jgi:hypothetical protein
LCSISKTMPRKVGKSRDIYAENEDFKSILGEFRNEGNQRRVDYFGRRILLHVYRAKNGDRPSSGSVLDFSKILSFLVYIKKNKLSSEKGKNVPVLYSKCL